MQDGTIGRRYARALALSMGDAAKLADLQKVDRELNALADALQKGGNAEFRQAMLNPSFSREQRQAILDAITKSYSLSDGTAKLLTLLVRKDRLPYLPQIARAFSTEVDERSGQVRAVITSARVLNDSQVKEIVGALEKKTGKKVVPEVEVEPEIIGGISARIGGEIFDNTVRSQLSRMRQQLAR